MDEAKSLDLVSGTYNTLRKVWADASLIILPGNNSQMYDHDINNSARAQLIIYAPPSYVWIQYAQLKQILMRQDPEKLDSLAAGSVSKVLGYEVFKAYWLVLDLGHLAKAYNVYYGNKS